MTLQEFEKATSSLKEGVTGDRYMAAELTNGKEQALCNDCGFTSSWDKNLIYCYNLGTACAVLPISAVVRVVLH